MLRACRRVLRPGGGIGYFNIFISHEAPREQQRAYARANRGQYSRAEQTALLRSAGFQNIRETDVSAEFGRTLEALQAANVRHAGGLRRALGSQEFENRLKTRAAGIAGVKTGVLKRSLFIATRPGRGT